MGFIEVGGDWLDMVSLWKLFFILGILVVVLGIIMWFVICKYMYWMYG